MTTQEHAQQPITAWRAAVRRGRRIGHAVELHETIGSTNDRARALLARADGEGVVVVAEEQLAGRGRLGRTWTSPRGVNLTASVPVRPRIPADRAWQLGLAAPLTILDACRSVGPVWLKWPNDVVDGGGRKVAGLLVETALEGERLTGAVVGFGVNVNWRRAEMPAEIRDSATSLVELAGREVDRARLLGAICRALESETVALEAGRSPLERYRAACRTLGQRVRVVGAEVTLTGVARDIDENGSLVVDTNGRFVKVMTGEVRQVRPMMPS